MALGEKTGGRVKGTPNKATAVVKAALAEAFERTGGVESLAAWGRENPTEFYKLWTRLLPHQVRAEMSATVATVSLSEVMDAAERRLKRMTEARAVRLNSPGLALPPSPPLGGAGAAEDPAGTFSIKK